MAVDLAGSHSMVGIIASSYPVSQFIFSPAVGVMKLGHWKNVWFTETVDVQNVQLYHVPRNQFEDEAFAEFFGFVFGIRLACFLAVQLTAGTVPNWSDRVTCH